MKYARLPSEIRRRYVREDMLPAAQQVADDISEKLRQANLRDLCVKHSLGQSIDHITAHISTFGPNAMCDIADLLGIPGGVRALQDLKRFALRFPKDFVVKQASTPMVTGAFISYEHFVVLSGIDGERKRLELLDRIRAEGLTVTQLRRVIAAANKRHDD
jgi:hypothetical protein